MLDLDRELADPMLARAVGYLVDRSTRRAPWFFEECQSACNLGIAQACAAWRPEGGATFYTLALTCMRNAIAHAWRSEAVRGSTARGVYSLEHQHADGTTLADSIPSGEDPAGRGLEWEELTSAVLKAAGQDRGVIRRRYFDPDRPTLKQVGRELGVTRERVRQLEVRGLARVRRSMERAG